MKTCNTSNLVIGYATGIGAETLRRFVSSIRRHCNESSTDIVIFTDSCDDEYARVSKENFVTLVPVVNCYSAARASKIVNAFYHLTMIGLASICAIVPSAWSEGMKIVRRRLIGDWIHPQAGRWFSIADYLAVSSHYENVMATDVRDVVFQGNPFAAIDKVSLYVFLQDGLKFGNENTDSDWYKRVYGQAKLSDIGGRTSICCGTVFGSASCLRACAELMVEQFVRKPRIPLDQAVFNNIIYDQGSVLQQGIKYCSLDNGIVLTFTGEHEAIWTIRDDRVQLIDGRTPSVLHMYDRVPEVLATVQKQHP